MTVLHMGSGLDSLNNAGFNEFESSAGSAEDAAFVRTRTVIQGFSGWVETPEWTAVQELWLHQYFSGAGTANADQIYFMDGSTTVLKMHGVGGRKRLSYLSAPATFTQIGPDFDITNTCYLDIFIKTGASGEVGIYLNGVEQMTTAGAMTYSGDITKIRWLGLSGLPSHAISGIIVADEPTIGWRVNQGYPSSNGANTAFTGDYASVDEAVLNEADYIYSGAAGEVETFGHTLVAPMSGYVPRAVAVAARIRRGGSGPQNAQLALRSGGTDYFSATKSAGLGYGAIVNVWNTNPDTSADWASSQISSLQPGAKSIA